MARKIIGDYTGTAFDDFLVLPGLPDDENLTPDSVSLESEICRVKLGSPFFTAAMRSVTGKELALAAGKARIMGVAPRGLSQEKEVEIVQYVKEHEVKVGEIESEPNPITIYCGETLGDALKKIREYGYSNIPVITKRSDFEGMFTYKPPRHDFMKPNTPITEVMEPFKVNGEARMDVCDESMNDREIIDILTKKIREQQEKGEKGYRFIPVLDSVGRLSRLVFLQTEEAYKVGAAIDTHPEWEKRAEMLKEAGADMIFIDTSDAYKNFSIELVSRYKEKFPDGPPLCAGNIVTPEAFDKLVNEGPDAIKVGMGPGSICSTNNVLGVGAPAFWAVIEVCNRRDEYYRRTGRYVPIIADGGIEGTDNMSVVLAAADGIMGGKIFGGFDESAGTKIKKGNSIVAVRIYGEASKEAFETTGDMRRYTTPLNAEAVTSFQGVSGLVPYMGRFKPGLEEIYQKTLKEALYHAGCENLQEYREKAVLIRLSERAKELTRPHGIEIISD